MSRHWQLQQAKNRFSEVVERALADGPQIVTRRGRDAVVVLSAKAYRKLKGGIGLKDHLRRAPLDGVVLDRQRDTGRRVDLP